MKLDNEENRKQYDLTMSRIPDLLRGLKHLQIEVGKIMHKERWDKEMTYTAASNLAAIMKRIEYSARLTYKRSQKLKEMVEQLDNVKEENNAQS